MLKVQIRALEVKTAALSRQFVVLLDDRFVSLVSLYMKTRYARLMQILTSSILFTLGADGSGL